MATSHISLAFCRVAVVALCCLPGCKVIHEQVASERSSSRDFDFGVDEPVDRATSQPDRSGPDGIGPADAGAPGGSDSGRGFEPDSGVESEGDAGLAVTPDAAVDEAPRVCALGGQYEQSTTLGRVTCLVEDDYRTQTCDQSCAGQADFEACCEALMSDFRALRASTSELQAAQDGLLGDRSVSLTAQEVGDRTQAYAWSLDNCAWEGCIQGPRYYFIGNGYYPSDPGPDAPRDSSCFVELCQTLDDSDP